MTEGIRIACAFLTQVDYYIINCVLLLELKIHAPLHADTVFLAPLHAYCFLNTG